MIPTNMSFASFVVLVRQLHVIVYMTFTCAWLAYHVRVSGCVFVRVIVARLKIFIDPVHVTY